MAKNKKAANNWKKKQRKTDILATGLGRSRRDTANLSSKEARRVKQAQERDQRALRNAKRKERMFIKTVKKKNPMSPKNGAVKKAAKTVQGFSFQKFPAEIRDMIYQYALLKCGNKKPALLDVLLAVPLLNKEARYALYIYYQINSFTLGLFKDSPLPPDIANSRDVEFMRNIEFHVPHISPATQLTTLFFTAKNIRNLTLTTSYSLGINIVVKRYLPSCKTLVSLTIVTTRDWTDKHCFPYPITAEDPVQLINKILGESGECHFLDKDRLVWNWVSQARAGEDGRGQRLPFEMRTPKLCPKKCFRPGEWNIA